ncbi:unnamed protein product [Camellia sinensis]
MTVAENETVAGATCLRNHVGRSQPPRPIAGNALLQANRPEGGFCRGQVAAPSRRDPLSSRVRHSWSRTQPGLEQILDSTFQNQSKAFPGQTQQELEACQWVSTDLQ